MAGARDVTRLKPQVGFLFFFTNWLLIIRLTINSHYHYRTPHPDDQWVRVPVCFLDAELGATNRVGERTTEAQDGTHLKTPQYVLSFFLFFFCFLNVYVQLELLWWRTPTTTTRDHHHHYCLESSVCIFFFFFLLMTICIDYTTSITTTAVPRHPMYGHIRKKPNQP